MSKIVLIDQERLEELRRQFLELYTTHKYMVENDSLN